MSCGTITRLLAILSTIYIYLYGDGNSGFGTNVGDNISGNPSFSTAMGAEALKNITSAQAVSGYGYQALLNLTTGNNNDYYYIIVRSNGGEN